LGVAALPADYGWFSGVRLGDFAGRGVIKIILKADDMDTVLMFATFSAIMMILCAMRRYY